MEIIVIDDGSTDNTHDVCKKYKNEILYFYSSNQGFAASLTKAVTYSNGEIILLLDADDYFLPDKVNSVLTEFRRNENLLFIYHDKILINKEGSVIKKCDTGGNTSTLAFKRAAAVDLLPVYNEQFFFTLNSPSQGLHLKKQLSYYRIHFLSMSKPRNLLTWKKELLKINLLHLNQLRDLIKRPPMWTNKQSLKKKYKEVASGYNYLKMEIALNRESSIAFKYYLRILYWDITNGKIKFTNLKYIITYFFLKRYIKY